MNQVKALLGVLVVAIMLAGCIKDDPPPDDPPLPDPSDWSLNVVRMDPETGCAAYLCRADPDGVNATRVRDEFGLVMLTDDPHVPGQRNMWVEGDWLVWNGFNPETHQRQDILAMHLPTREVYGVAMGPGHSIRPQLDDGRVVFQYAGSDYVGLASWDVGADKVYPVTGPKDVNSIWTFDAPWVAYRVIATENESLLGEWAWNIDTEENIQFYHSLEYGGRNAPDERVTDVEIWEGNLYYVLSTNHPDDSQPSTHELFIIDLETGSKRQVSPNLGRFSIEPMTSERLLAIRQQELPMAFLNLEDGSHESAGFELDRDDCTNVESHNGWISMDCGEPNFDVFHYYDIGSDSLYRYAPGDQGFLIISTATNGETVVFTGGPSKNYQPNIHAVPVSSLEGPLDYE